MPKTAKHYKVPLSAPVTIRTKEAVESVSEATGEKRASVLRKVMELLPKAKFTEDFWDQATEDSHLLNRQPPLSEGIGIICENLGIKWLGKNKIQLKNGEELELKTYEKLNLIETVNILNQLTEILDKEGD